MASGILRLESTGNLTGVGSTPPLLEAATTSEVSDAGNFNQLPDELTVYILSLTDELGRRRIGATCHQLADNAYQAMPPLMRCLEGSSNVTPFTVDYADYCQNMCCIVRTKMYEKTRTRRWNTEMENDINARVCLYMKNLCLDLCTLSGPFLDMLNNNSFPQLQRIELANLYFIPIVARLTELGLPELSALILYDFTMSDLYSGQGSTINAFIAAYPRLRHFTMLGNVVESLIDDSTMTALSGCSDLQTLVLPYTSQAISSDALMTVARSCIFLQGIDLTGCDGVTDEVVEAIATKCDLCAINLSYCNNITPHAAQLLTVASDIEWINLWGAKHIAQHEDRNTVAATLGNARKKGKLQQLQYFLV